MVPFAVLLPLVIASGSATTFTTPPLKLLLKSTMDYSTLVRISLLLGLVGSFLSSFDSALISAIHVTLLFRLPKLRIADDMHSFYFLAGTAFLIINLLFLLLPLLGISNPYALANMLLGLYVGIAGILIGTNGVLRSLSNQNTLLIITAVNAVWSDHNTRE